MSSVSQKSILDIFQDMSCEDITWETSTDAVKDVDTEQTVLNAIQKAAKAQVKWKTTSSLHKATILHRIQAIVDKKLNCSIDYFSFYSNFIIASEEYSKWHPVGTVLLILPAYYPLFVFYAVVSAALAAGCSVIVQAFDKRLKIFEKFFEEAGLQQNLFTVVSSSTECTAFMSSIKIDKIIFFGDIVTAQNIFKNNLTWSFNFLCPHTTAAMLLEPCDINAAIEKILSETWHSGPGNMWAVSTIVVQESIYKKFEEVLKLQLQNFIYYNSKSNFQDKFILNQIQSVIKKAAKTGAKIIKKNDVPEAEWSPTFLLQYFDQDIEPSVPVIRILICRTAKEGVTLVNHTRYCLGTSIWTCISSQALECAPMLNSNYIWINCHGRILSSAPFNPPGFSGNATFGGTDGLFQYMSLAENGFDAETTGVIHKESLVSLELNIQSVVLSACKAFNLWHLEKDRKSYFQKINFLIEKFCAYDEQCIVNSVINYFSHSMNIINFSENSSDQKYFTVQKKIPIGVIVIYISSTTDSAEMFATLLTPPLAIGNAVIIVLNDNSVVPPIIQILQKNLPKDLLQVINKEEAAYALAGEQNVQAFWIYSETNISAEFLKTLKHHLASSLKRFWIVPKQIPRSTYLFWKECSQTKIIWLTNTDQIF